MLAGAVLLLGGCAVGGGGDGTEETSALRKDLAVRPQPLTGVEGATGTTGTTPPTTGRPGSTPTTSAGGSGGSSPTTTSARPRAPSGSPTVPFVVRATVADATRDPDGQAPPPYGDVVSLQLEDDGTRARFTVEVAGEVPARAATGEQVAVGVDLWRGGRESEYQLYARGNDEGWLAWLQTPSGFVAYPGTFELGGSRLVFTVPWSGLGGRRAGSLSTLVEWEKDKAVVLADASADRAPDGRSTQSFSF